MFRIMLLSYADLKSRNKAPAVRVGGRVEDERLDAGHRVEAGEDEHEGESKEEDIQLLHLEDEEEHEEEHTIQD